MLVLPERIFSLVSKCLETHLIHKFISHFIQKGCVEKICCWVHLTIVWHALKEPRAHKSNLPTISLDTANTYGSISPPLHPHPPTLLPFKKKLILFALHRYGVSAQWIRLIETYYKGIFSKSFSESATSPWHFCWLHSFYNSFLGWCEDHTWILNASQGP